MYRSMTENANVNSLRGWTLEPAADLYPVDVAPPSSAQNVFFCRDLSAWSTYGPFHFTDPSQPHRMDATIHEELLNESVRLYGELWRDLARR